VNLKSIVFFVGLTGYVYGQGCSDAGFCTLNGMKPNSGLFGDTDNQFKVGLSMGGADRNIGVLGHYFEYNTKLSDRFSFDTKITALGQQGNGISSYGFSDIYLNGNLRVKEGTKFLIGGKLPLSNANKKQNDVALPMDYQASLGTVDLILGLGQQIGKLQIMAGYQQPITQNKNRFKAEDYPAGHPLRAFQTTNLYNRSGDVLLRLSYLIIGKEKLKLNASLLPIYHLANDTYTDAAGIRKEIVGSQGITLNANAFLDYDFNASHGLQLNFGMPLLVREARPDGLTRSGLGTLEYRLKF
jgi:hypothetical protein